MVSNRAQRFPKEFKKQKLVSLDWRFATIVLISLIFHVGFIYYFAAHLPNVLRPDTITQIQQRYANLLLERDLAAQRPSTELSQMDLSKEDILYAGFHGKAPAEAGEVLEATSGLVSAGGRRGFEISGNTESNLPTAGEMAAAGGRGGGRRRNVNDIANEVGEVGFLRILTSGSGYVPQQYIDSINDYSESEHKRLGSVLSSLDAMQVSRGPDGKGWGTGQGGPGDASTDLTRGRVVRGTRRESRALDADQLIGALQPTGTVSFENIERDKEGLNTTLGALNDLPAEASYLDDQQRVRRKPEYVQQIIAQHQAAILDCYKRILKQQPDLKGEIEIRFAIDKEGRIAWAEIVNSTLNSDELHDCMLRRIKRWNDFGQGDPNGPPEVYRQTFTFGY
jgi:hypothetical protein